MVKWAVQHGGRQEKSFRFHSNAGSDRGEEMFGSDRNYRSDITGMGVRLKSELVFEMGRILHTGRQDTFGLAQSGLKAGRNG
jgi:hypothetical protein